MANRWARDGQEMVGQRLQWRVVVNIAHCGSEFEKGDGGRESQTEARGDECISLTVTDSVSPLTSHLSPPLATFRQQVLSLSQY